MLWGVTLRSPHPHARILRVDIDRGAGNLPGVFAVLTHDDVPGQQELRARAPGPAGARRSTSSATRASRSRWSPPTTRRSPGRRPRRSSSTTRCSSRSSTPRPALRAATARWSTPAATWSATSRSAPATRSRTRRRGGRPATTRSACRTRRSSARSPGSRSPTSVGGVDLYVATQWLHVDQRQVCAALGLRPEQVRLPLAGVGGAFGGREDLSMHVHGCLLALHTGKPVKMVYNREESFFGHVHRHPARDALRARRGPRRQARLRPGHHPPRRRRLRVQHPRRGRQRRHDGPRPLRDPEHPHGLLRRLHQQPAVRRDARLRFGAGGVRVRGASWTSSPTRSGSTRSRSGSATASTRAPRRRPARSSTAPRRSRSWSAGSRRCRCRAPASATAAVDLRRMPGGVSNTTHGEGVRRGVGYAVAYKNVGFSEGFDDYSTARVRLGDRRRRAGRHRAHRGRGGRAGPGHRRAADLPHRARRRARRGGARRTPRSGPPGRRSASRQTYVTGGAVKAACESVAPARRSPGRPPGWAAETDGLRLEDGGVVDRAGDRVIEPRRPARGRRGRGHRRVAAPADVPDRPGDRPGLRPRAVRLRRAPRGRRRRRRPRPGEGGRARLHPGRRQGDEPAGRRRPDPGRQHPGHWAWR